jgi:uncharacterized membrane protein YhhN
MIDKKKLVQRLNKGSKLKELPVLHLAIILVTILEVFGECFRVFYLQMLKPIPIILMIIYIHDKNRSRQHFVPNIVEAGLVLSLIGDVCLMSKEMSSFMIGTCFFVLAHLLYIIGFRTGDRVKTLKKKYSIMRSIAYIVIALGVAANIYTLWDKFPSKIIFVPYVAILGLEMANCLSRYERTVNSSFYFVLIGMALFTVSDNLLGYLKFNHVKTDLGRCVIMITYYSAQYFLMHGALHQSNLVYEINKYHDSKTRSY